MNNNPIGCEALLILRYHLAESVSWFPTNRSFWEGAHVAKSLIPFERPSHRPFFRIAPRNASGVLAKPFGQTSPQQVASGNLKKAPNLGDNKRGYDGLKLELAIHLICDFGNYFA